MPSRRRIRGAASASARLPEVPETVKIDPAAEQQKPSEDGSTLPEDLRKMLEAAYT